MKQVYSGAEKSSFKMDICSYIAPEFFSPPSALCAEGVKGRLGSLLWLLLQLAGLVSVNLICGFIRDMAGSGGFILIYVAMGLFLILFSVYLFLNEINSISMQRDVDAEALWDRSEN